MAKQEEQNLNNGNNNSEQKNICSYYNQSLKIILPLIEKGLKKEDYERTQNFNDSEKLNLVRLIKRYKAVIECKKNDSKSVKQKQIEREFNSLMETIQNT